MQNVIWIDQNNNQKENKEYLKIYSKELTNFKFTLVTSIEDGYSCLEKLGFQLIYIILSGRLAEEFLDSYEENLKKMSVVTLNIIFCYNGKFHSSKKYANDPFYNPGGVVTEFEEVIQFLKMDNKYPINNQNLSRDIIISEDKNLFLFIEKSIENISFPIILKKFSSRFINEEDLIKFKQFLINNYYKELKNDRELNILRNKIKIPYYLFTKIFIRLLSMETSFYKDLNAALLNKNFSDFNQFIFTLYSGLNLKIIEDCHTKELYRSGLIEKTELYKIINSKNLVLTKQFLSFSKNKEIVIKFLHFKQINENLRKILFVVNPLNQDNIIVTNIDIEKISYFPGEEEVLFLPFSGFEISEIKEENEYTIIYLNYLIKYEKDVKDYIDAQSKDRVEEFLKKLIVKSQSSHIGNNKDYIDEESINKRKISLGDSTDKSLSLILKNIFSKKSIDLMKDIGNKKNVLWIDQYCRCKVYDDYLNKFSEKLKDFYFEKATTIREAFLILSNYEFKLVYIIINDKLSDYFFLKYEDEIKKLGVVTANIIFCDEEPKIMKKYFNDPFLNPGKIVTNFSKVVDYLNKDEYGFKNILKLKETIDNSFTGKNYGNIFKEINKNQMDIPIIIIKKIISNLPNQESIAKFKNFVYTYGKEELSKAVNPSLEKKIDLPLYIYPKFYMRLYGLNTKFYYDINKYLSNHKEDFGLYDSYITILYYGLSEKYLICNDEFPFYRGGVISKKELTILEKNKKSKINLYYCNNFLSFSKSEEEANKFLGNNLNCDDSLFPTRFIIEKNENISNLMSNVEMRHYSTFATEKEVLFLPLSSFRITDISDSKFMNKNIKIIKLNYVGMLSK